MGFKIIENFYSIMNSLYPPRDQVVCRGNFTYRKSLLKRAFSYEL